MTAKMEYSVVGVGACREKGGIDTRVGIGVRVDIGASFSKDIFRLFWMPLLLYRALFIYSGGVGKWALFC